MTTFILKTLGLIVCFGLAGLLLFRLVVVLPPAGSDDCATGVVSRLARQSTLEDHVKIRTE